MSQSLYARLARRYAPERFSFTRRQLLKASAAASAGVLLSNCEAYKGMMGKGSPLVERKITVIGAGFAGLACAYELKSAGYQVTVLEARNRVGGRVVSFADMVPGRVVEGGGEYIGDNHPTWEMYARKFGLTFREIPDDKDAEEPLLLEGRRLTREDAKKIFDEMDATLGKLNEAAKEINADQPWLSPNAPTLDRFTMAEWLANVQASPLAKRAIQAELEANESVPLEKQSYLAFLAMVKGGGGQDYWTLSETKRCAQGNQALAKKLAEKLDMFSLHLNKPVTAIERSTTGVNIYVGEQVYTADDVVITLPPSVWQRIRFTPELPPALQVQMGVAVKHISGLKKRIWEEAKLGADSLSDSDVSMTWEATAGYDDGTPAALASFSGGPAAARVRMRPASERMARYQEYLGTLYPGYVENLQGVRFMDWPAEPYTQAAYSFAGPGQVTTAGPLLYKGGERAHFAGEYTCFKFCGYMEGALSSGVSVARRIAQRDGVI